MTYLNGDGIVGGATNFLTDNQGESNTDDVADSSKSLYMAKPEKIIASVQPEAGLTLIFFHPMLHEGGQLLPDSGLKYILRTDIMFERDQSTAPKMSENQIEALHQRNLGSQFEDKKDFKSAIACYKRAEKLEANLQ